MEKSKLSQLVTEILSYAKERYGSIATPDAATVVCAAATLLSSDGSYNTTDEDDQKKLVRKLVELSSDNVEPTLKKDQKEHQFSPSFVANESILSISTSNPGVAGDINPFAQIDEDETQFLKLWNILHTTKCSTFVQNVDPVFKPKDMPVKNLETGEIVTPEEALRSIGDHLPPIPTKEEFEKNLPAYKDVKPFHEVLHDLKPCNTKREKLTKAEQIEFKICQLKKLERKYSDMWEATINDPDGVEESEPFLNKQEEIGEQIVKLEQKLKELKKNQN